MYHQTLNDRFQYFSDMPVNLGGVSFTLLNGHAVISIVCSECSRGHSCSAVVLRHSDNNYQ